MGSRSGDHGDRPPGDPTTSPAHQPRPPTGERVRITRRQLLGGSLGLAAAGLMAGCSDSPTGFALLQSTQGPRVTSGRSVSCRYKKKVHSGSLLVAIVSRTSTEVLAPTIGQVADDQGNHWLQAVEYFGGDHYGVDIWYCESARGGSTPTVKGTCLEYPVLPGISGMDMALLEYAGASGFDLCDQISQADVTAESATATTNFPLTSDHELAISVITGDMESASPPKDWISRTADLTQRYFVADSVDTGASSAGERLERDMDRSHRSDGRRGHHGNLRPEGSAGRKPAPRPVLLHGFGDSACRIRAHRLDVAALPGESQARQHARHLHERIDLQPGHRLRLDRVGHRLGRGDRRKAGQSGVDNHTGINISCLVVRFGGRRSHHPHRHLFQRQSQQLACLLLELANLPPQLKVQSIARRGFPGGDLPHLATEGPVSAGDIGLAFRTSIYVKPEGPSDPGLRQVLSDTTGANALLMLNTPSGELTASWSGDVVTGGLDSARRPHRRRTRLNRRGLAEPPLLGHTGHRGIARIPHCADPGPTGSRPTRRRP